MKHPICNLMLVAVLIASATRLHAQGYIVPNGVITNHGNALPGEISVLYNPATMYYTGFYFTLQGPDAFRFAAIIDVGVRVFFVDLNDPVAAESVLSGSYAELTFPEVYLFADGIPFYVGLYTGNQPFAPADGIYNDPLFGWAQLVNNGGVIELLDSALVYKAQGIYAGTLTFVPEPTVLGLLGIGGLCFLFKRLWK